MPLLMLFLLASAAGTTVCLLVWRFARTAPHRPVTIVVGAEAGERLRRHRGLRARLTRRLDPAELTGLALTVALLVAVAGGVVFGVLAALVRGSTAVLDLDQRVARWVDAHDSAFSTGVLNALTDIGAPWTVVAFAVVLGVAETVARRSRWSAPFLVVVVGGTAVLTTTVKDLADRARPAFNAAAETLGPSFPSGHSSYSAAFFAAAALLLGRGRRPAVRAVLAGAAAGLAVAIAASRVLLDVHWLSDVVAGLALGWAWFSVSAIAFGGRLLRFGAAAEVARGVAGDRSVSAPAE